MIEFQYRFILPAAFSLLPTSMRGEKAEALVLAIGLQESKFLYRRQIGGPARGFWQFEETGVRGVLRHALTDVEAAAALTQLCYRGPSLFSVHDAIGHNDVLACAFARLLLWTLPDALPNRDELDRAWTQYLAAWRPGKPHPETWKANYERAWALVRGETSGESTS